MEYLPNWPSVDYDGEPPILEPFPYVYLDGVVLKRSWAGEVSNVSVLVAIGVNDSGYRKILGIAEGAKEDKAGWSSFFTASQSARAYRRAPIHLRCLSGTGRPGVV